MSARCSAQQVGQLTNIWWRSGVPGARQHGQAPVCLCGRGNRAPALARSIAFWPVVITPLRYVASWVAGEHGGLTPQLQVSGHCGLSLALDTLHVFLAYSQVVTGLSHSHWAHGMIQALLWPSSRSDRVQQHRLYGRPPCSSSNTSRLARGAGARDISLGTCLAACCLL